MSNTNSPFGFLPIRRVDGAQWNDVLVSRQIAYNYATVIGRGDLVVGVNDGTIAKLTTVGSATSRTRTAGVFWGCQYYDPTQQRYVFMPYWPAASGLTSTQIVRAFVIADPNVEFECRLGNSSAAPANVHVGTTICVGGVATAPTTGIGTSAEYADYATISATDTTANFLITGWSESADNDTASAYAKIRVVLNNCDFKSGTAGV